MEILSRKEYSKMYYPDATKLAEKFDLDDDWKSRNTINHLIDDLYEIYYEKQFSAFGWNKTEITTPKNGMSVIYFFRHFGTTHIGIYDNGTFCSNAGFCDEYDAPYWKVVE